MEKIQGVRIYTNSNSNLVTKLTPVQTLQMVADALRQTDTLTWGAFDEDQNHCTMGQFLAHLRMSYGNSFAVQSPLFLVIPKENDKFGDKETPSERYVRMVGWINEMLERALQGDDFKEEVALAVKERDIIARKLEEHESLAFFTKPIDNKQIREDAHAAIQKVIAARKARKQFEDAMYGQAMNYWGFKIPEPSIAQRFIYGEHFDQIIKDEVKWDLPDFDALKTEIEATNKPLERELVPN